ncbi:MAG TPA: ATP-binding cassette domain-containing protein [Acidimicrobiales bacterium]|nr:ATP-binding cassette domain-containing protein [Acidimicrobiales bacterium]
MAPAVPALRFDAVSYRVGDTMALRGVDWTVEAGERWVVLGPNGAGKTSLLRLAGAYDHPTVGTVDVLGCRLGRVDVRALRTRIGMASGSVARMLRPGVTALEIVLAGQHAALETWWHDYSDADRARAQSLLDAAGFGYTSERSFGVLSEGERQQMQLARTLMGEPELLLLDEPAAGLDVGGRERLVTRLAALAADPSTPPTVFVTHHVEEIPSGFTSALLLRAGQVVAAGPLAETLTSESLSECFGLALRLRAEDGRYTCRAS